MNTGEKDPSQSEGQNISYLLKRGVAEVIVEQEMGELLRSGKKLRLKEGFDPSAPDIHLGHMVTLRKLRQFQGLGHQVVLIVADWTAQIGDPSGYSVTRPMLSKEEVLANAQTYLEQFFKVVDKEKTEVRWQSEWFGKFTLSDVIQLTSRFTIAQVMARDDFSARYSAGRPISIVELLYPLLQAYDSVAVEADVEFGGTDQKFNLLVGRELQSMMGQRPQQLFLVPILVGTDGSQKMSKSLGNYIGVAEPPDEIYGKVMSIPDSLIMDYFELVTDVADEELEEFRQALANDSVNPMELKKRLAREIVIQLYDQKAANEAEERFAKVFQKREVPEEIPECPISFDRFREFLMQMGQAQEATTPNIPPVVNMNRLLVEIGLAKSHSEAGRLIAQGAVEIDGEKLTSNVARVNDIFIIKVGKRRFAKVINTDKLTE
jgi:tyrosyl-tRNA synthetase